MNQHFAIADDLDDEIVPATLIDAHRWIESVVSPLPTFDRDHFLLLPALPSRRTLADQWVRALSDQWAAMMAKQITQVEAAILADRVIEAPWHGRAFVEFIETDDEETDEFIQSEVVYTPKPLIENFVRTETYAVDDYHEPSFDQAALDFPSVFLPSPELVRSWIEGVAEFAKSGGRTDVDKTIFDLSVSASSEAFVKRLVYVIANYAHQRSYEEHSSTILLAANNRIDLGFQLVLSEFLPLVPDRSHEILSRLHDEFTRALREGWKLESEEWGRVELSNNQIVIHLRKPSTVSDPDFDISTEG